MIQAGPAKILAVVLFALAACAGPAQAGTPGRVLSLAPSITRELFDLGAGDLLVGATSYCPVPEGSRIAVVGAPGGISIERAYALKPDIVLASTDCNSRSDVAALERLGLTVRVFAGCEDFACMCAAFRELGDLVGRRPRADAMISGIEARLARIRAATDGRARPRVFWQLGATPLVTAGGTTFAGELLRLAGAVNVFDDAAAPYPRVNAEEVLRRDPDVIIVVTQMGQNQAPSSWDRFRGMAAVRSGRVHEVSADLVCQPTPAMFLRAVETVGALLHPGAL